MILNDQLTFKDHIAKPAWSCRFALHNIGKIRPFLTEYSKQLLIHALVISRQHYCNAFLAWLPTCAIRPLQMIQNAAARLVFNYPRESMSHLYLPALATSCGSHQVQIIGTCLQNSHGLCILLPLLSPICLHFLKSVVRKLATAPGLIAKRHKITLLVCFFSWNFPVCFFPYPESGMTYLTPSGQPNPSQSSRKNWKLMSSMSI